MTKGVPFWQSTGRQQFPILFAVYKWLLVISPSSAGIERVFSKSGLFSSKKRIKLTPEQLSNLMFLSYSETCINFKNKIFGLPIDNNGKGILNSIEGMEDDLIDLAGDAEDYILLNNEKLENEVVKGADFVDLDKSESDLGDVDA